MFGKEILPKARKRIRKCGCLKVESLDRTHAKDLLHERESKALFCFKHFNHKGFEAFYMHTN